MRSSGDAGGDVAALRMNERDGGVTLAVHVSPGARRSGVLGVHGDALKVAVSAPPEGGRANEAVLELIAEIAGVKRGRVRLASGPGSHRKQIRIEGMAAVELGTRLAEVLGRPRDT